LALVFAAANLGWHLTWAILVLLAWAQPIIDSISLGTHDPARLCN